MRKFWFILFAVAMLMGVMNLCAQETETGNGSSDAVQQAFGIHFGNVSGNGYSWRYLKEKWGLQIVVGGLTSGNNDKSFPSVLMHNGSSHPATLTDTDNARKYYFNLGANVMFPLRRTPTTLFYLHAGSNWQYIDQKQFHQTYAYDYSDFNTNYYAPVGGVRTGHKITSYANLGMGPGFEFMMGKYLKMSLELPITYTGKDEFYMYIPQAGLYYYFK